LVAPSGLKSPLITPAPYDPVILDKASRELGMMEGSCGSRLAGNRLGGAEASLLAETSRRRDGDVARCSDSEIMHLSAPPHIRILYGFPWPRVKPNAGAHPLFAASAHGV
jgi:hypothetical protein